MHRKSLKAYHIYIKIYYIIVDLCIFYYINKLRQIFIFSIQFQKYNSISQIFVFIRPK
jgi:hypothetical protein